MSKSVTILLVACVAGALLVRSPLAAAAAPEVRQAVARAVPYVEQQGRTWIEEKKCVSCHRVAFTTWALSRADTLGFELDREQLEKWRDWSRDQLLAPPKDDAPPVGTTNLEGVSQILLAEQTSQEGVLDEAARTAFVGFLTLKQKDDGQWDAGGQLPSQKRPQAETQLVSTAWNALALGTVD